VLIIKSYLFYKYLLMRFFEAFAKAVAWQAVVRKTAEIGYGRVGRVVNAIHS
jgi:hypothetical protein